MIPSPVSITTSTFARIGASPIRGGGVLKPISATGV